MRSRLLAAGALVLTGALAWLAVINVVAARVLQALILASIGYVSYLAWRGWQTIRAARSVARPAAGSLPWITVIVPARDEEAVIADVVTDILAQEYADERGPRFDLLVVDDGSTDRTAAVARDAAESAAGPAGGERFGVVRREPGSGPRTKGAALAHAHGAVRGEVVAVLDADSMLAPDYLALAIAAWSRDPGAVALQTRRSELNAPRGWLQAAQEEEHLMDLASQCGRWVTDGTAELRGTGMFVRRAALEDAGGWDPHTVTEDLEMSTRLAAAGEHITIAPEAVAREEAVERLGGLWAQRMRWAEGSMRRLIDHGPGLLADGRLPLRKRLDFLLFTTEFVVPPLFLTSIAASLVTIALPGPADWTVPVTLFIGYGLGTFLLAAAGLAATGASTLGVLGRATRGSLFLSHWLLVVPLALLRIAVGPPTREFARTPRAAHRDR